MCGGIFLLGWVCEKFFAKKTLRFQNRDTLKKNPRIPFCGFENRIAPSPPPSPPRGKLAAFGVEGSQKSARHIFIAVALSKRTTTYAPKELAKKIWRLSKWKAWKCTKNAKRRKQILGHFRHHHTHMFTNTAYSHCTASKNSGLQGKRIQNTPKNGTWIKTDVCVVLVCDKHLPYFRY